MVRNNRVWRGIIALMAVIAMFSMAATAAFALADEDAKQKTAPAATETPKQEAAPAAMETPEQEAAPAAAEMPEQETTPTAALAPESEPTAPQTPTTPAALTPGGNLSLASDVSGEQSTDKQFVTLITKNGNYFYLVIDRAKGSENVYFLNLVDESDLMALVDSETPMQTAAATQPAIDETPEPADEPEPAPEPEKKNGISAVLGIILLAALLGGGAFFYFKVLKPKRGMSGSVDISELDGFDFDGDEDGGYSEAPGTDDFNETGTEDNGGDGLDFEDSGYSETSVTGDFNETVTADSSGDEYGDTGAYAEISFEQSGQPRDGTNFETGGQPETEGRE